MTTIFKRIIVISLPAVLFPAFLCLVYVHLLMGARRLVHDTFISLYPVLVYLSDSLAQGVFPFWDPFSTPGFTTSMLGFYCPLLFVIGWLFPCSADIIVLELVCFGAIGMVGTYLWLRYQPIPKPLALAGAVAYVGSGPFLNMNGEFGLLFTASFIPWLFWSVDLLTAGPRRRDALRGTFIFVVSAWLIMTGGYPGLNYMTFLFVGIYGLARLCLNRASVKQAFQFGTIAVLLTLALLFLPLSEMTESFVPQMLSARKMGGDFDPFAGSIAIAGPLNLFFPNGVYLPEMFSNPGRLMYMGVILAAAIPAGLATVRLSKMNAVLLGLALMIMLASMGSFSPVAAFFIKFIPGFSLIRWHAYNANLVVLLLIALSLRLFDQYQARVLERPGLRLRYALMTLAVFILAALTATVAMFYSRSAAPLSVTWYDVIGTAAAFILSGALLSWWFLWCRHAPAKKNNRMRIWVMSMLLLAITLVVIMCVRFIPSGLAAHLVRMLHGSQQTLEHVLRYGLPALTEYWLDTKFISVPLWRMFAVDILQLGLILAVFLFCIFRYWRFPRQLSWTLLLLVFVDMLSAAPRYDLGHTYYIYGQMSNSEIHFQRPTTISYNGNDRDPSLSYVSLIDWKPIRGYVNMAAQLRRPTFVSGGCVSFADQQIRALMRQPGGVAVFSKVVWLLPQDNEISLAKWEVLAKVPDIQSLSLQPNRLEVTVNSSNPARLVWTDAWAAGWRVSVNGAPAIMRRVLGVFKGVDIPPGRSQVIFIYRPVYYVTGMALLIIGLVGLGILAIWTGLSSRKYKDALEASDGFKKGSGQI